MSTINTQYRNYVFPLKDEDLESSNNLLRITTEAIDRDINQLFTEKANAEEVYTSDEVDQKVSDAITEYDNNLDIYGTYSNGDVNTDPNEKTKLLLTEVMSNPGVWTKVTVDSKGRVTSGANITKSDLTDFTEGDYIHWSERDDNGLGTNIIWSSTKIKNEIDAVSGDMSDYVPLSSYTDEDVLNKVKNEDGSGSGLDADLLDGEDGAYYLDWDNFSSLPTTLSGFGITDKVSINSNSALTSGTDINLDLSTSEVFNVVLTSDANFTGSNLVDGLRGSLIIKQDSTGSRVASFGSEFKFPGGTAPTLSTAADAVDKIDFVVFGTDILCTFELDFA